MTPSTFPSVPSGIINTLIRLAETSAAVSGGKYPDGVQLSAALIFKEDSAEEIALDNAIYALTLAHTRELFALMYLGRDGLQDQTLEEAIVSVREMAYNEKEGRMKHALCEKASDVPRLQ